MLCRRTWKNNNQIIMQDKSNVKDGWTDVIDTYDLILDLNHKKGMNMDTHFW